MRKFSSHLGIAAPLIRNNIDTDAIIPSVEMKRVSKQGLSGGLFAAWRYADRVARVPNPDFILNREAYAGSSILLGGKNFGCGSSREHAVWALDEYGIRAIIAPSFGSIFYANCIANGLLPVILPQKHITSLVEYVTVSPARNKLLVNLEQRLAGVPDGEQFHFEIAATDAEMLINGWDPVALTLQLDDEIRSFVREDELQRPWVYLK